VKIAAWIKGSALLAVVFASGIVVGTTYERGQRSPSPSVTAEAHDPIQQLTRVLDLDSEQQRSVAAILDRHQSDVDAAWHAMQPHMRATLASASAEIIAVLRPDQAAKYRTMIETAHPGHHR
jgi:CHASE1-domain containing sensor protein